MANGLVRSSVTEPCFMEGDLRKMKKIEKSELTEEQMKAEQMQQQNDGDRGQSERHEDDAEMNNCLVLQ